MRVICNDLDDMLTNLKLEMPSAILQRAVRVSTTRNPQGGTKQTAMRFNVTFNASAVVRLSGGGEYLLEFGEDCGTDYMDEPKKLEGSERAAGLREKLVGFCDDYGLLVRPGIIEG